MVKSTGPSPYMRRGRIEYTIYEILYNGYSGQRERAIVAAGREEEAISMLEKSIVEDKGYENMRGNLNPEVTDTGFKSSRKKGLISGWDAFSNSKL